MYRYAIAVNHVIDGDTIKADVALGLYVVMRNIKLRLAGVNCPELKTPEGQAALLFTRDCVDRCMGKGVADTIKVDKYGGRWDAVVYLNDDVSLNEHLIRAGHGAKT